MAKNTWLEDSMHEIAEEFIHGDHDKGYELLELRLKESYKNGAQAERRKAGRFSNQDDEAHGKERSDKRGARPSARRRA